MKIIAGFRDFILRGNVIDLAVAVVIGAAFSTVITTIVDSLIGPIIASIGGSPEVSGSLVIPLPNDAGIQVGTIINAIINFVIVAAVVYFVIVTPVNRLLALRKKGQVDEPKSPTEDILLLTEIRDLLAREGNVTTRTQGDAS